MDSVNNERKDVVSKVRKSKCLAVGGEGDFPGAAAALDVPDGVPAGSAQQSNGCHTSSTSWVVGNTGHQRQQATGESKAAFCRLDGHGSPMAEDDPATSNVHRFKTMNEANSSCEIKHFQDIQVSEEDTCRLNSDCFKSISTQGSPFPTYDLEEYALSDIKSESDSEESSDDRFCSKPIAVDKNNNRDNSLLHTPISEVCEEEAIPKHRRVDNVSFSTAQQSPDGQVDHLVPKSHTSEKSRSDYLLPFPACGSEEFVPDDIESVSTTSSNSLSSEYTSSSDSEESSDERFCVKPVDDWKLDDIYREGKEWLRGEWIGWGATCSCYKATDVEHNYEMAVKQIDTTDSKIDIEKIKNEIDLMQSVQGKNIVPFIRAVREKNYINIFMKYMPGRSVAYHLKDGIGLDEAEIKPLMPQLLTAVEDVHRSSVHRDIKSANLLLDGNKELYLGDFGLAAMFSQTEEFKKEKIGTPSFMAPEVKHCDGITPYTYKCDIWSVGCVLVHMYSPSHLEHIRMYMDLEDKSGKLPLPTFEDPYLQMMMELCLQVDSNKRPTARELLNICFP